jgi:hypothetical protein
MRPPYFVGHLLPDLVLLSRLLCFGCPLLRKVPPADYRRRDADLIINDGQAMDLAREQEGLIQSVQAHEDD